MQPPHIQPKGATSNRVLYSIAIFLINLQFHNAGPSASFTNI